jgi:deferrochelatase/peroxidase EfeB
MIRLDTRNRPITDAELLDPDLQSILTNLQGHILHSHGRDRSIHIFLRFLNGEKTKSWIAKMASHLTSAHKQLEEAKRYKNCPKKPGDLFCCFFLSAHGYDALGIPKHRQPADEAFQHGMGDRQRSAKNSPALNDPPQDQWDPGYRGEIDGGKIDAMLLLADDAGRDGRNPRWNTEPLWEKQDLPQAEQVKIFEELLGVQGVAKVCAIEYGRVIRDPRTDRSYEHFGYVDGRSQPLFFEKDLKKEGGEIGRWNPEAGPSLVLAIDPNGAPNNADNPTYGSYLVFRKLEQRVRDFQDYLDVLKTELQLKGHDQHRAEALLMGRFRDGTPVVLRSTPGQLTPVPNNFDFTKDPQGLKCPFQAHIRRMNPRGEVDQKGRGTWDGPVDERSDRIPPDEERSHRIARRSVTYGRREIEPYAEATPDQLPEAGVGLLFMCYQQEIARQFEFLQATWANNENLQAPGTGVDALIGSPPVGHAAVGHTWPLRWNGSRQESKCVPFQSFVNLKGGEYFFAPSLPFLRNIEAIATSSGSV